MDVIDRDERKAWAMANYPQAVVAFHLLKKHALKASASRQVKVIRNLIPNCPTCGEQHSYLLEHPEPVTEEGGTETACSVVLRGCLMFVIDTLCPW
jgi:hypothetical protein